MAAENLIDELLEDADERMDKSVESAQHEFATVRTGRASPALLDRVVVDYYGAMTPLNQLATISAPEARLLTVQPYDKSSIKAIEKAINESDVGLNPSNDGNVVRLVVPELTEERRRELVKVVRNLAEEGRVAIRNVRRDTMHAPARAEGRGRGLLRRRAPRRGRAAEAHRRAHRRARRRAQGQGRGDPRGLMGAAGQRSSAAADPRSDGAAADRPMARYVAIITDGNGRWARARGLPVNDGHSAGADTVKARLRDAAELGIEELTVYSFSTENWSRPAEEVAGPDGDVLRAHRAARRPSCTEEGVRMRFIGRREGIDPRLAEQMGWAEELTRANERITLFVAFNYGGRAEILDAATRFQGGAEEEFRACLYAPEMHDPDLIIRTSGERRLSNYLLWQSAYSELVFRDELWPDFTRARRSRSPWPSSPTAGAASAAAERADGQRTPDAHARRACAPGAGRPRAGVGIRGGARRRGRDGRPSAGAARRQRAGRQARSDLSARILVAIPAIAVALFLVIEGGLIFALGLFVLGVHLHARALRDVRARPPGAPGRLARRSPGCCWRRYYGGQFQVLLVAVAALPLIFGLTLGAAAPERRRHRGDAARDLLDRLRARPRGAAARPPARRRIVIDVLVGTFLGDTGAYLGGRMFGKRPLAPHDLAQQDRRGPADRHGLRRARRVDRGALPGLAARHARAGARARRRARRARRRPVRVVHQARGRHEGLRRRCSAPTAARSTASTRCCSRPSSATTSGRRTCTRPASRPRGATPPAPAPSRAASLFGYPSVTRTIFPSSNVYRSAVC